GKRRAMVGEPRQRGRKTMAYPWLVERLRSWKEEPALVWRDDTWSFSRLCDATDAWLARMAQAGIDPGSTLAICGDYSPNVCALLLASVLNRNIVIPLTSAVASRWERLMEVAQVRHTVQFTSDDCWQITHCGREPIHSLLRRLQERETAGLVLFSSGS